MRRTLQLLLLLAVAAAGVVLPSAVAQACSCAWNSPTQQLRGADAAFTGEIIGREGGKEITVFGKYVQTARAYTIEIDRVFKGSVAPTVTVLSPTSSAGCGIELPASGDVLVFGYKNPEHKAADVYSTGLCSGTRVIKSADAVPAALGVGEPPIGQAQTGVSSMTSEVAHTPMPSFWDRNAAPLALAVLILVIAGVSTVLVVRQQRKRDK